VVTQARNQVLSQRFLGAAADHRPFLLRHRGIDVEHERVHGALHHKKQS
jgi:hypothetical protein